MKIKDLISEFAPVAAATAGRLAGRAVAGAVPNILDKSQTAKKPIGSKLKSTLNSLQSVVSAAGGGKLDTEKTAQVMTRPIDPSKPDPNSAKVLQPLIPALSQAMQDPQAADQIQAAIKGGVKSALTQQVKNQQAELQKVQKSIKQ